MIKIPPTWQKILTPDVLKRTLNSPELRPIIKSAQEKYYYWDKFRLLSFPPSIKAEEAWAFLKITQRSQSEPTPIKNKRGQNFTFTYNKTLFRQLSEIDVYAAGNIETSSGNIGEHQAEQLIISGLSEEAIASSQLEGASTSRKVAKEMIYANRKPRNLDEQMIINNYQVMKSLENWKDIEMSEDLLLEIQSMITNETLEDSNDSGRFRTDADEIKIYDKLTGDIIFEPPEEKSMRSELKRFIDFANKEDGTGEDYVHPVIKAIMLHFWLACLHPFVDGNGRTSRAVYYWYLLKRNYWLFQYLSVSRIIKESRKSYDNAFLHSELDDNDLTYFILYNLKVTCSAIRKLHEYSHQKFKEAEKIAKMAKLYDNLNQRQIAILSYFKKHPKETTDIKTHQSKSGIVYESARRDLMGLLDEGFVSELKKGKKFIYVPNIKKINKFLYR